MTNRFFFIHFNSCGIVLCSRDAKFAVECDTCRLSYCLVCLASGSKDPCVRCRTRPSKRMEQLVHLRLKSIYKAFKQNSSSTTKSTNARERQNDDPDEDHVTDDPEALFQAAASAAKTGALKKRNCSKYHKRNDSTGSGNSFDKVIRFKEEKEKADAAASALLAELEEEEEAEKTKVGRKNKKKKKKDKNPSKNDFEADALDNHSDEISSTGTNEHVLYSDEEARNDDRKQPPTQGVKGMVTESTGEVDPYEKELCRLVAVEDMEGLENLMETIKGIPGRAILRKNAKKALKRMRLAKEPIEDEPGGESPAGNIATVEEEDHVTDLQRLSATTGTGLQLLTSEHSNLLKILSYTHNKQQSQLTVSSAQHTTNPGRTRMASTGPLKSECVMHMAPSIVGWVIGKGGQRIRDLMEENSVRVWIDQSSMGASDPRMVYVSGLRQNVDTAVERIKELVSNAPTPITRQVVPLVEPTDTTTVQAPPKLDVSDDRIPSLKPKFGTVNVQAITSTNDRVTNDNRSRHVMTCEPRFVALLIGRRGWTIKNIQDTTGVKVDIDQTVSPRKITISGNGEDDIENAIRMVQDVLSYPHAQLQPGMEHSQLIAHASILNMDKNAKLDGLNGDSLSPEKSCFLEQCTPPVESTTRTTSFQQAHTPPPSSLIMTGDARTSTSTTSSLSTTPEPGALLQSTIQSPYAEVETGAFISPQHSRTLFSGDTNQLSLNQMSSLSPLAAHPIYHPQPLHNFQSSRDNVYGSLPLSGQPIHATGPLLHHSSPNQHTHSTFRSSVQNDFIPLTSARDVPVRNPNIPYQSSQNIYHDNGGAYYNDEPISSFWNATSSGIRTPSGPDSFRLDAAVDFLEHSKLHSTMVVGTLSADVNEGLIGLSHTPDIPQQSIAKQDQSLSVQTGGDDAQMIDSLFGPALTVNDPQLLTGLQGISLHDESTSIGLWGSSHNANDTGLKSLLEAPERDEPLVLAGMQQTLLAAERKSQSRFAWGEHNGH